MKISKLFHWLYFMVMMLPLFVVPIYFIYSQRHDLTEQTQVDIQYKYQSNEVNTNDDLVLNNIYYFETDLLQYDDLLYDGHIFFQLLSDLYFDVSDLVIDETHVNFNHFSANTFIYLDSDGVFGVFYSQEQYSNFDANTYYIYNSAFSSNCIIKLIDIDDTHVYNFLKYTDYNEIESVQVEDTNTSITNAFVNSFADTIDKYFNYDNVINFGTLYSWLNLTFFNNQAPLGFFIFWHLLEYWLLTSLLWVLFDVLLYVPNLIHRWLDKASLS